MECNCSWSETVLGLVVVVLTLWMPGDWAKWLVVIAGLGIIAHSWMGHHMMCQHDEMKSMPARRRKRR